LLLLVIPAIVQAQSPDALQGSPPIEQPLVREGTLAVRLAQAFGLVTVNSEAEAESWLGEKGISPRNGWIADYPVTPDIVGELRATVGDAADARKIPVNREEALRLLDSINAELALSIKPADGEATPAVVGEGGDYVAPDVVNNYYYEEGPPVVTYYAPPDDFYYLYSWVPYPFWCSGFWFGGFFVLNDFHRSVFIGHGHNHHRAFVSNHFRGERGFSRIDPVARFNGRSGFDAGSVRRSNYVPAGGPGSRGTGFTAPRTPITSGIRHSTGDRHEASQSPGRWRTINRNSHSYSPPAQNNHTPGSYTFHQGNRTQVRSYNTPSVGVNPVRSFNTPTGGVKPVRSYNTPSVGVNPVRSFNTPSVGVNPVRSFEPSRSYTPSSTYMPVSRTTTMPGNAFRGGGSFSGRSGRR
jgi:hypothetical protein